MYISLGDHTAELHARSGLTQAVKTRNNKVCSLDLKQQTKTDTPL